MSVKSTSLSATGVARWMPALAWLGSCQKAWLRFALLAGLTAAAVVIDCSAIPDLES